MSTRSTGPVPRSKAAGPFDIYSWTLQPGRSIECVPRDWDNALVIVRVGDVDVTAAGARRRFASGSILTFAGLPSPIMLINAGATDAVVATIQRTATKSPADQQAPAAGPVARFLFSGVPVTTIDCTPRCGAYDTKGLAMSNDDNFFIQPNPDLEPLDRLVGTWDVTGGAIGTTTYEWMEGRHFLLQRVDLEQFGQRIDGLEVIGHNQDFGTERDPEIRSCFYDNMGNTMRYVFEVDGDVLTIWGGEKGSPAFYRGTFSPDGNVVSGDWVYPDGGGYTSTMTRKSA